MNLPHCNTAPPLDNGGEPKSFETELRAAATREEATQLMVCVRRTTRICVAIATQSCISTRDILDGRRMCVRPQEASERGALTRHDRRSRLRGGERKGGWDMTCHLCVAEHHYHCDHGVLTLLTTRLIKRCCTLIEAKGHWKGRSVTAA